VFIQDSFGTYYFCCKRPKLGGECNNTLVVLVFVCIYILTSIPSPYHTTDSGGVITGQVRNYFQILTPNLTSSYIIDFAAKCCFWIIQLLREESLMWQVKGSQSFRRKLTVT